MRIRIIRNIYIYYFILGEILSVVFLIIKETQMERKFIKVEKNNEITNVIINRPSKLNALSQSLIQELETVIKLLSKDENIRCVIISGEGRAFSSGADIIELKSLTQPDARRFITLLHKAFQAIRDCPVPVIAKIDGPCLGGGLELAICCDIRAASERYVIFYLLTSL